MKSEDFRVLEKLFPDWESMNDEELIRRKRKLQKMYHPDSRSIDENSDQYIRILTDDNRWNAWLNYIKESKNLFEIDEENNDIKIKLKEGVYCPGPKLTIPNNVTVIYDNAFSDTINTYYMKHVQEVVIPRSVRMIGKDAFRFCEKLRSVSFEHEEKDEIEIRAGAFSQCQNLLKIIFPKKTVFGRVYGEHSVLELTPIKSFDYYSSMKFNQTIGDVLTINGAKSAYKKDGSKAYRAVCGKEIFFKDHVVGTKLFKECNLHNTTFPDFDHVRIIEDYAFSNAIVGGKGSYRIEKLPPKLEKLGKKAYENCILPDIMELPSSLIDIGEGAFINCSGLKVIRCTSKQRSMLQARNAINDNVEYDIIKARKEYKQEVVLNPGISQLHFPVEYTEVINHIMILCSDPNVITSLASIERDIIVNCYNISTNEINAELEIRIS